MIECPRLEADVEYVTFGGNGKRRGCGYLLFGDAGWLARAGYNGDQASGFLDDLATLADELGLIVVGLVKSAPGRFEWFGLDQLQAHVVNGCSRRMLQRIHLRIYTRTDYAERWDNFFQPVGRVQSRNDPCNPHEVRAALVRHGLRIKALAYGVGRSYSLICKMLKGKRRCDERFLIDALAWIEDQVTPDSGEPDDEAEPDSDGEPQDDDEHDQPPALGRPATATGTLLEVALNYLRRGMSIVPQLPAAKKPCVKWKSYQDRPPTEDKLRDWWEQWAEAGIAVVLGPVSGLFVVDVDGPEAHAVLIERLGGEPLAPKVLSGSRDPYRYHLFFQCPDIPTKAKKTPWHPKLEFRGKGGIVIAPPSLHKSGNRYCWERGQSLDDIPRPEVPPAILEALQPRPREVRPAATQPVPVNIEDVSPSTRAFLSGEFSEGPGWNDRLFQAACDLAARGVPREASEQALLAGARPWDDTQEQIARRTIESAYSQPREASRV